MSTTAQQPATTPIPVQLSAPEFDAFLLPHLSMPKRGPQCKLGYYCVFNLMRTRVQFTVAKHPRQRRQRIRAEARTFKTGPANGVRHQNGRDTKSQPALLYGGHAAVWLMRANRIVHNGHESADKGCRFSKKHGRLQAIGALSKPIRIEDHFSLTRRRRPRIMAFR